MVRHCGISLFFWGPCLHVTAIEPEMWSGTQHIGAVWSSIRSCLFHCWVALGACKNPAVWPRILLCIISCLVPCFSCSIYRVIQSFRLSGSVDCYVHRWGQPGCQNVYLSTHTFLSDVDTLSIFIGGLVMIVVPFPSLGIIWVCPSRFADQTAAVVELSPVNFFVCSIMSSCARARNRYRSPLLPSSRLGHRFVFCVFLGADMDSRWPSVTGVILHPLMRQAANRITDTTFKPCLNHRNTHTALDHFLPT